MMKNFPIPPLRHPPLYVRTKPEIVHIHACAAPPPPPPFARLRENEGNLGGFLERGRKGRKGEKLRGQHKKRWRRRRKKKRRRRSRFVGGTGCHWLEDRGSKE